MEAVGSRVAAAEEGTGEGTRAALEVAGMRVEAFLE